MHFRHPSSYLNTSKIKMPSLKSSSPSSASMHKGRYHRHQQVQHPDRLFISHPLYDTQQTSKPATPVHSLMTVSMPRSTARSWWRLPSISVLAVRWFPPKRLMVPTLSCACTTSRPQSFPRSLPGLPPSDTRCAWARRSPACFTAAAEVYLLPLPSTAYTHVLRLVSKP